MEIMFQAADMEEDPLEKYLARIGGLCAVPWFMDVMSPLETSEGKHVMRDCFLPEYAIEAISNYDFERHSPVSTSSAPPPTRTSSTGSTLT